MCMIWYGLWAKAEVISRQGSLVPRKGAKATSWKTRGEASSPSQTRTQIAMIAIVRYGRSAPARPPKTVTRGRSPFACSRMQSTHWTPTAALRWQSGHTGRRHRWQRM